MYQYYRIITSTVNTKGGAGETIEKCYKEVKTESGKVEVVPCTEEESILKYHNKISTVGGNDATQDIKCLLLKPNGDVFKIDEVNKPAEESK